MDNFASPGSPLFESITGSDSFWDGSVSHLTTVASSEVSVSNSVGSIIPTLSTVTHTVSRPVNTTGSVSSAPGMCMTTNLPGSRPPVSYYGSVFSVPGAPPVPTSSWSRAPWSQPYPYMQFQGQNPYANFWPPPMNYGGFGRVQDSTDVQSTTVSNTNSSPSTSSGDFLKEIKNTLSDFQRSFQSDLSVISNRLSMLESQTGGSSRSSPARQEEDEEREADCLSTAPGSQERVFLDSEEADSPPPPPPQKQSLGNSSSVREKEVSLVRDKDDSVDEGSPIEPETDDSSFSKEQLRARVYTLMRDVAKVPFASPPKPKKLSSTFEASCGLDKGSEKSYFSFPEGIHISSARQIVDDLLARPGSEKQSTGKFSGFRPTSFTPHFRVKDFEIFDSTLGKSVPSCDKAMSTLLDSKPVDGLRLTQASWSNSESLLRTASQVIGTGEHYLSTVGTLLQDFHGEPSCLAEVKAMLLQLNKCLGASQLLLMGTLANFSLSKRAEILDKSPVSENLKDSLLKSPLTDKIFGLSLQQVQEEISKVPPPVKVNVHVNNGKRSVSSTHASSFSSSDFKKRKVVNKAQASSSSSGSKGKAPPKNFGSKGFKKPNPRP